jgi:hypothetical protein
MIKMGVSWPQQEENKPINKKMKKSKVLDKKSDYYYNIVISKINKT